MRKTLLMGETKAGKSSLIRALSGESAKCGPALAVEYCGDFINTPGEFLENRRFYTSFITASADCKVMLLVQDATRKSSLFPPQFAAMFNRKVIGVVTKTDLPDARPELAERFLRSAGARRFVRVSAKTGHGLDELKKLLG